MYVFTVVSTPIDKLPDDALVPLQSPEAVHDVGEFVDDQTRTGLTEFTVPLVGDAVSVTTGTETTGVYVTVNVGVSPGNISCEEPGETTDVYPATAAGVNVYKVPLAPGETVVEPDPAPEIAPGLIVQLDVARFETIEIFAVVTGFTTTVATAGVLVPLPLLHASVYVYVLTVVSTPILSVFADTRFPLQSPDAVHDVGEFVDDQVRAGFTTFTIPLVGFAEIVTTGIGGDTTTVTVFAFVPPALVHVSV